MMGWLQTIVNTKTIMYAIDTRQGLLWVAKRKKKRERKKEKQTLNAVNGTQSRYKDKDRERKKKRKKERQTNLDCWQENIPCERSN